MKFQRVVREELTINLTPLIDVVFLLLIFFMVTTTFSKENHLSVNLPEANGELLEALPNQIELLVSQTGRYAINGNALVNSNIETLMSALREIAGEDRSLPLILIADADATHQSVVRAMDAIAQLGFARLSIATKQGEQDRP